MEYSSIQPQEVGKSHLALASNDFGQRRIFFVYSRLELSLLSVKEKERRKDSR